MSYISCHCIFILPYCRLETFGNTLVLSDVHNGNACTAKLHMLILE